MAVGGQIPIVAIINQLLRGDGSLGLGGVFASGGVVNVDSFVVEQGGGYFLELSIVF